MIKTFICAYAAISVICVIFAFAILLRYLKQYRPEDIPICLSCRHLVRVEEDGAYRRFYCTKYNPYYGSSTPPLYCRDYSKDEKKQESDMCKICKICKKTEPQSMYLGGGTGNIIRY